MRQWFQIAAVVFLLAAGLLVACSNERRGAPASADDLAGDVSDIEVGSDTDGPDAIDADVAPDAPDPSDAADVADVADAVDVTLDASDVPGISDVTDAPDTMDADDVHDAVDATDADIAPDLDTTPDGRPPSSRAWCNDLPEEPDTCNCAHPDDRCVRGGLACARPDTSACTEDSCPSGYTCSREGCVCDQSWTCFGACETNLDCPEVSECDRQTRTCEPPEPCRGPCWPYVECFLFDRPTFECLVGAECGPDGECFALHEVIVTSTACGAAREPGCGAMEYRGMDDRCYILRGCTYDEDCPAGYVCNGGPLFDVCSRGLEEAP